METTFNDLLLYVDTDAILCHDGQKNQKWRVFGASGATRFQRGAVYAEGMPDPTDKITNKEASKMTADELRATTARMRAENDYFRERNNRMMLESDYKRLLREPADARREAFFRTAKTISNSAPVKFGVAMLAKASLDKMADTFGEDFANSVSSGLNAVGVKVKPKSVKQDRQNGNIQHTSQLRNNSAQSTGQSNQSQLQTRTGQQSDRPSSSETQDTRQRASQFHGQASVTNRDQMAQEAAGAARANVGFHNFHNSLREAAQQSSNPSAQRILNSVMDDDDIVDLMNYIHDSAR